MCFTLLIDYSLKRYFDPSNSDSLIFYPLKIKQKCQCVLWDSVALLQKKKKKRDGYLLVRDMELYGQEK